MSVSALRCDRAKVQGVGSNRLLAIQASQLDVFHFRGHTESKNDNPMERCVVFSEEKSWRVPIEYRNTCSQIP